MRVIHTKTMPDRNISTYASSHFYDSIDLIDSASIAPQKSISWVRVLRQNSVFGRRGVGELTNAFSHHKELEISVWLCAINNYIFGTDNISVDSSCPSLDYIFSMNNIIVL